MPAQTLRFLLTLVAALLLAIPALAKIIPSSSLIEILKTAQRGDLVVLDIDDTILTREPDPELDSYETFMTKRAAEIARNEKVPLAYAESAARSEFRQRDAARVYYLTEKKIGHVLRKLQRRGITVIGLTGRHPDEAPNVAAVFKNQGLKLHEYPDVWNTWRSSSGPSPLNYAGQQKFKDGIIFAGYRGDKGVTLRRFMTAFKITPKRIIFVDDRKKFVDQMEKEFGSDPQIEALNYQYSGAARRKAELCGKAMGDDLGSAQSALKTGS